MNASVRTLVLALGFCAAAQAAQPVSPQGWCQVSSPDFTVISQMSPSDTADWAGRLNQFLHALKGRLPVDQRLLGPFTLVLFKSNDDYWASAPVLQNGVPLANVAAFSRAGDWGELAATCELGSSEQTQRMIFGTGVNWLLSADHRYRPLALITGLSEVYGAYVTEGKTELFGQPVRGWTSRLQRAQNHVLGNAETFLSIEDLLSVRDYNPVADVHGVHMFFVESWGLAHFLLFSKDMANEHAMDRLLAAFSHHHNAHEALKEAFGDGLGALNLKFQAYIQGGDFYEVELPIELPPALGAPAPADPAFVASTLSRLEAVTEHLDQARAYAQQAVQLAPADPRPLEAMVLVDYAAHRYAEAADDFRGALRLGTKDGPTWLLASLVEGRKDTPDKIPSDHVLLTPGQARQAMDLAEKAILLDRGLERAYNRVAHLVPTADRVTEDDGKFLALGRMLFPNNGWVEIGQAQWAHRMGEEPLAKKILDDVKARAPAFTQEEVDRALSLEAEWLLHRG